MSLDTQTFGLKRFWIISALNEIPKEPAIFSSKNLNYARKQLLAGKNQISSIKNWLLAGKIVKPKSKGIELTELGKLILKKDPKLQTAWTWWMIHINLCSNKDAFPYSTFFTNYDVNNVAWIRYDELIENLTNIISKNNGKIKKRSVQTYFDGINTSFKQGYPFFDLQLIQRRFDNDRKERIRRAEVKIDDLCVLYSTLSFIHEYHKDSDSIEARSLIELGAAKALGITNISYRDCLSHITADKRLSKFISYSKTANLDSISIKNRNLFAIQNEGYTSGVIEWK